MKKVVVLLVCAVVLLMGDKSDTQLPSAVELYKKACDGGNMHGCGFLGFMYEKGDGVRQDIYMAKEYYGKACDLGDQDGCDEYKRLNK